MNTDISFPKTEELLNKTFTNIKLKEIESILDEAIKELSIKSPNEEIARSWSYEISKSVKSISVSFNNSYIKNGQNIVVLIMSGHATKSGNWVKANDFATDIIDEAIQKISKII